MRFVITLTLTLICAGTLIGTGLLIPPAALAEEVTVLSAEVLEIGGKRYRIHGIDAPEKGQQCWAGSHLYRCDRIAMTALMDLVAGSSSVECTVIQTEASDKAIQPARCYSDGYDLAEGMTYTGWALADPGSGAAYRSFQETAAAKGHGLWRGRFVMPWDWRAGERLREETSSD